MTVRVLTFCSAILMLLTVYSTDFFLMREGRVNVNAVLDDYEVARSVSGFILELESMEAAQRGYLLDQESRYLDNFKEACVRARQDRQRLVSSRPAVQMSLDQIKALADDKERELRAPLLLAEQKKWSEAVAFTRADSGYDRMAMIRRVDEELRTRLKTEIYARRAQLSERRGKLDAALPTAGGVSLLLFVLAFGGSVRHQRAAERAAERYQDLNADLSKTLQELTHQTRRSTDARRALATSNEELRTFAYSVAHDLRAPLRTINSFAGILLSEHSETLSDEGKEILLRVMRAAIHGARLIDHLLSLSQVSQRKLNITEVNMEDLVRSVYRDLTQAKSYPGAEFTVQPLVSVPCDEELMRLVWQNLLGNALKFTSKREHPRIEVGMHRTGIHRVTYFVRDNGAGFDGRFAVKMFDVFQRLHSSKDFEGTGVGLAIVKKAVLRHGGAIRAEGVEGKGATFLLTLKRTLPERTA